MKVLMISTDRFIFDETSVAAERMREYGTLFDQLHIIVFSRRFHDKRQVRIADNCWAYPTHSWSRLTYIFDAIRTARRILSSVVEPGSGWVITTQDPFETGLVGRRLKKIAGIPFQAQVHTDIGSPYFAQSFLNKVRLYIARQVLKETDRVRVVSSRIKQTLVRDYGIDSDSVDVLPIYTDVSVVEEANEDIHAKYQQFGTIVLMASRLTKEKNIPCALRAFARTGEKHPEAGMVVVGTGPEEQRLKKLAKKLGIENKVIFEGWKDDVSDYFKTADIFLLTSDYEGYGRTLFEAARGQTAIVSTDVGIIGDTFVSDEDVFVCPPRADECLGTKIAHFLSSSEMREKYARSAHEKASAHFIQKQEYHERFVRSIFEAVKHS